MIDSRVESAAVCSQCLPDPGLARFIGDAAIFKECDYCERVSRDPIAARLADVADHVRGCLYLEYDLAANHLPWEGREGGWQWEYWTTLELLEDEIRLGPGEDLEYEALQDLASEVGDQDWCRAHPFSLTQSQALIYGWRDFVSLVQHRRRYFFLEQFDRADSDAMAPSELLGTLMEAAVDLGCARAQSQNEPIYRARAVKDVDLREGTWTDRIAPADIGPPPEELALQANRMSPIGIPMFYGSYAAQVAVKETAFPDRDGLFIVGEWRTRRELVLLDLTKLATLDIPSLFDLDPESPSSGWLERSTLAFFQEFLADLRRPVIKDGRDHFEYVPTQIVTEFVRSSPVPGDVRFDGIRYPSAKAEGIDSLVLFANQADVVQGDDEDQDPWLALEDTQWWRWVSGGAEGFPVDKPPDSL